MEENNKKKFPLKWIVIGALIVLILIYFFVPSVNEVINKFISTLSSGNLEKIKELIRSYGTYAMLVSFFLMVLSSVIAPLPAFFLTLSNAAIFGWWQGAILSWVSAMAGAILCFYIARALGRDTVEKYAGKGALASVEGYFEKYGSRTILICRLLPFVSFDAVSYFAGLTPIKFIPFLIATGLGQLPATLVYSYVGGMLTGGAKYLMIGLLCLFAIMVAIPIIKTIYERVQKKKKAATESSASHE